MAMLRGPVKQVEKRAVTPPPKKELSLNKLDQLFTILDSDGDGRISSSELNLIGISTEDLTALSAVLFEMEDNKSVLTR